MTILSGILVQHSQNVIISFCYYHSTWFLLSAHRWCLSQRWVISFWCIVCLMITAAFVAVVIVRMPWASPVVSCAAIRCRIIALRVDARLNIRWSVFQCNPIRLAGKRFRSVYFVGVSQFMSTHSTQWCESWSTWGEFIPRLHDVFTSTLSNAWTPLIRKL